MFDTLANALDWLGIAVFALTRRTCGFRKDMDIVGFILLGSATGIGGGGTIRDICLATSLSSGD